MEPRFGLHVCKDMYAHGCMGGFDFRLLSTCCRGTPASDLAREVRARRRRRRAMPVRGARGDVGKEGRRATSQRGAYTRSLTCNGAFGRLRGRRGLGHAPISSARESRNQADARSGPGSTVHSLKNRAHVFRALRRIANLEEAQGSGQRQRLRLRRESQDERSGRCPVAAPWFCTMQACSA